MNTETASLCCYCCRRITGDRFVIASEARVLRLHPSCVSKLSRNLDEWVFRGQQKSFALAGEFGIAVFMLGLLCLPPSSVLELAAGIDEWICEYEKFRGLAAPQGERSEMKICSCRSTATTARRGLLTQRAYDSRLRLRARNFAVISSIKVAIRRTRSFVE